MKKILIINPNVITREGIKGILESEEDLTVVGEGKLEEAVSLVENSTPDLLIIETINDKKLLYKVISSILESNQDVHILLTSDNIEVSILKDMISVGVIGFIKNESHTIYFMEAIKMVSKGIPYISPNLSETLLKEFRKYVQSFGTGSFIQLDVRIPFHLLTKRECDVLQLLAEGKSNREIAEITNISDLTVKNHVSNILLKMNVKDRTNAVLLAIKEGWVYLK